MRKILFVVLLLGLGIGGWMYHRPVMVYWQFMRAKNSSEALLIATRYGYPVLMRRALKQGASANDKLRDWTPLYWASMSGGISASDRIDVVKELLAAGADSNIQNKDDGATALMGAVRNGDLAVVKELIAAGANPNLLQTTDGWTALMGVASCDDEEVGRKITMALLEAGADPHIKDKFGWTVFDYAKSKEKEWLISLILEHARFNGDESILDLL